MEKLPYLPELIRPVTNAHNQILSSSADPEILEAAKLPYKKPFNSVQTLEDFTVTAKYPKKKNNTLVIAGIAIAIFLILKTQ